jgi:hypothetical protein
MPVTATTVSSHFKLIFLTVLALTVITLALRIGMALMVGSPNDSVKDAMTTCGLLANAGFGAILGLIGGKVS